MGDGQSHELEHCSTCYLPTTWVALPLLAKREYNLDSTVCEYRGF